MGQIKNIKLHIVTDIKCEIAIMANLVKLMSELRCGWSIGSTMCHQIAAPALQCGLATKATNNKQPKDDNKEAIKRPATPYAAYVREKHAIVRTRYPDVKAPEVMKHVGRMWKNEPGFIKMKYKKVYETQMETYKKTVAALEPPKRPAGPYAMYTKDNYALVSAQNKGKDLQALDIMKLIALRWKNESVTTKERYARSYTNAMETYQANLTEEDMQRIKEKKDNKTARETKQVARKYGKAAASDQPKEPRVSAYSEFLRGQKGIITGKGFLKEAGLKWRGMSDAQKAIYQKKADAAYAAYEDEVREWEKKYI